MSSSAGSNALPRGALFAGRYRVESLVGLGGMGEVYSVFDELLSEKIALKVANALMRKTLRKSVQKAVHDARASDMQQEISAPRREVLLARRVTHPNVARVFDLGIHDGQLFITMELIPGAALHRRRRLAGAAPSDPSPGEASIEMTVALMHQVASALAAAHDADVLHLDLKPGNILIEDCSELRAVVIDFGIARALGARAAGIGSVDYMAPEQLSDVPLDGAADVYAFGLVLYELLSPHRPFSGQTAEQRLTARIVSDPRPLPASTPPAVASLVLSCLAREPGLRPTMREVQSTLASWLPGMPSEPRARPADTPPAPAGVGALAGEAGLRLLQARHWMISRQHVRAALEEIEAVLSVAPDLDIAIAMRALAAMRLWNLAGQDDSSSVRMGDGAVAAVMEAFSRAPHLADTHVADALLADAAGDTAWAVRALHRALSREPLNAWAHELLGRIEVEAGIVGAERARFAAALDPGNIMALEVVARDHLLSGRVCAADEVIDAIEALPLHGISPQLLRARAALWTENEARARATYAATASDQRAIVPLIREGLGVMLGEASLPALRGRGAAMLAVVASPRRHAFLHQLLAEFLARVAPQEALEHIVSAASSPMSDLRWLDACPALAPVRAEPAFRAARALVKQRVDRAFGGDASAVPLSRLPDGAASAMPSLSRSRDGDTLGGPTLVGTHAHRLASDSTLLERDEGRRDR